MGKHAYLILAHKNFGQLRKLIELLDDSRNDIYVHVDAHRRRFNPDDWRDVCHFSKLVFLPDRIKVHWGGVSIMRSEIRLLKCATSSGHYDYYHLLSGMDLPIKSQDYIHEFFDSHKGKEFINLWELKDETLYRFRYFTLFPEGEHPFYTRYLNYFFKALQVAVGYRMNRDIDFYFGAQWFSITDNLARYIVEKEPWLENVFHRTSICDEVFLPTLVCNSHFRDNLFVKTPVKIQTEVNLSNMRFIDWSRGESVRHPCTFRAADMELLESVEQLWARKFDENIDSQIIDMIYAKLKPNSQKVQTDSKKQQWTH